MRDPGVSKGFGTFFTTAYKKALVGVVTGVDTRPDVGFPKLGVPVWGSL